jgi:hypothetical protein
MQSVDTGRDLLKHTLVFRADPDVKRIVFVCVPHRGSSLAVGTVDILDNGLIRAPRKLVDCRGCPQHFQVISACLGLALPDPGSLER